MAHQSPIRAASLEAALQAVPVDTASGAQLGRSAAKRSGMPQRRSCPRVPLDGDVRLVWQGQLLVHRTVDLSASGMRLGGVGSEWRPADEVVILEVRYGNEVFDMFGLRARVVWVRDRVEGRESRAGLEIRPAAEAQVRRIADLLTAGIERYAEGLRWDDQLKAAVGTGTDETGLAG